MQPSGQRAAAAGTALAGLSTIGPADLQA